MRLLALFTWRWSLESQEQQERASSNLQALFKLLILSHWLKQVTWLNSESVWKGKSQGYAYRETIMIILQIIPFRV